MTDTALFNDVLVRIGEYLETDVSHLTPDSKLSTSIEGLNSLKMFEMILYLEDCFGVEFDEAVMDKVETLGGLVDHIQERQAAAA